MSSKGNPIAEAVSLILGGVNEVRIAEFHASRTQRIYGSKSQSAKGKEKAS